jgi:hypothetical protein
MMSHATTIYGHEQLVGIVRRSRSQPKPIILALSPGERLFLLHRLKDRTATADAIVHHPPQGAHLSPWTRDQVLARLSTMIETLRGGRDLIVINLLDKRLVIEAIEGNSYFSNMHSTDPRLTADAVRAADALRRRIASAIGCRIKKIKLGAGRVRL